MQLLLPTVLRIIMNECGKSQSEREEEEREEGEGEAEMQKESS